MNDAWLAHHGVKGQKWGIRRYQNEDGSLTPAGEKRAAKKQLKQDLKTMRKDRKQMIKEERKKHDMSGNILKADIANALFNGGYSDMRTEAQRAIRDREVNKKVTKRMMEKYGEQKMSELKKSDTMRDNIAFAATVTAGLALIGASAYMEIKNGY